MCFLFLFVAAFSCLNAPPSQVKFTLEAPSIRSAFYRAVSD